MTNLKLPSREVVEALCNKDGARSSGIPYDENIWIKYSTGTFPHEADIQRYLYKTADPSIVRIPQVFDSWTKQSPDWILPVAYIVMERIHDDDILEFLGNGTGTVQDLVLPIAKAVRHIWSLPLPPDATVGPLNQGIPHGAIFSDLGAPRYFTDLEDLENWINEQLTGNNHDLEVSLRDKQLHICHNDLSFSNIRVGDQLKITFTDWGRGGIYPIEFEEYSLLDLNVTESNRLVKPLHKELFGPKFTKQMKAFNIVHKCNQWGFPGPRQG